MANTIKLTYNEVEYTLEFTRETVREMADRGFKTSAVLENPIYAPDLFEGAFLAHHRKTTRSVIEGIYNKIGDKQALFETLIGMYSEPIANLFDEPENDSEKLAWVAN